MRKCLVLFVLMGFVFSYSRPVFAYWGEGVVEGVGAGAVIVGKGTYNTVEFVVTEVFRPIKPITQWMTRKFGKVERRDVTKVPV